MSTNGVKKSSEARCDKHRVEDPEVELGAFEETEAERRKKTQAEYLQRVTPWRERLIGKKLSDIPSDSVRRAIELSSNGQAQYNRTN
jgi:hypothetical protein